MATFKQKKEYSPSIIVSSLKELQNKFLSKEIESNNLNPLTREKEGIIREPIGSYKCPKGQWNNQQMLVKGKIEDKEGRFSFEGISLEECLDALLNIKKKDKVSFLYLEFYAPENDESEDSQEGGEEEIKFSLL